MKKLSFILVILLSSAVLFSSCKKETTEEPEYILRTDSPSQDLWSSISDYGRFTYIFIEPEDLLGAVFMGSYQTREFYEYWDSEQNVLIRNYYTKDLYKISGKKYYGKLRGQLIVSLSRDYYLISGSDLAKAKEIMDWNQFSLFSIDSFNTFDSQFKTIAWPRPNSD